ncbi:MAG: thiamine ABC transporter ATP-binding protein [Campylobacteraceae bacterium]|nr:thiamine ABC transporter ATP-binding protein [Campylobacteraceae bacterium]
MLKVKDLRYDYEDFKMHFDFEAKNGEITAILGDSGAGKSTLLSLIAGFITPLSGDIYIDGESILSQAIHKRDISILFQENNLFAHLNLFDNIALGINPKLKLNHSQEKLLLSLAESFQIKELLTHLPSEVSGGQKQRAALCRTILRKKSILLLDEPFSALDESLKDELLILIKGICEKENLCVLMVTHSVSDAKKVASCVLRVEDGKIKKGFK